jgi:hypothetical protein
MDAWFALLDGVDLGETLLAKASGFIPVQA